ncbi:MAG: M28 family peptidase [Gammaproteobacteria bacterium]|nr:M28 family peptidase [Gammaproteobacteria bacterium]
MHELKTAVFGLLVAAMAVAEAADEGAIKNLTGFVDANRQLALETSLVESLSATELDAWSKRLSAHAHHAGSPYGRENVRFIAELFRSWGYDVVIEAFDILLPVPKERELVLEGPRGYRATLIEDVLEEDASSAERDEVLPPYNAFSKDGNVRGELVFVNYGIPEDYEMLERYGIDVTGKIVIAKYGKSWRGIKPKLAAEHGAIGAIIYSDPADDGYIQGDVYPDGPFKNDSGVQRGSVMDMPLYPGDVLTPGEPAIKGTRRLKVTAAPTISKIPVLPISYRDALPLLKALGGEVVPAGWSGALPITYHIGPGPARVKLRLVFDWQRITIENVIARLEGAIYPDEWVIRGNHHDGWNHGASDPVSGLVALLGEAKGVGMLAAEGARPARTVIYAAWDAEEPGLIGSTEWVEKYRRELDDKAVTYLNTDGNGRGFVFIGGSHTLEGFFNEVMASVTDPQTMVSLAERRRAMLSVTGDEKQRKELENREDLRIAPLGSGSDYTPFLQHLGIASANFGFGGESSHGSYHTLYDTYQHYTRFRDPGFAYAVTLAELTGRTTLRMANARVLPFRFGGLADSLELYLTELEALAQTQRDEAKRNNRLLEENSYGLALDATKSLGAPKALPKVPFFNFAPLKNALAEIEESATALDKALDGGNLDDVDLTVLNRHLYQSERKLTSSEGLPGRDWYRHQVYAPGFYTGYGVKTLPRVREAIEAKLYDEVDHQIAVTAGVLEGFAEHLEATRALIP